MREITILTTYLQNHAIKYERHVPFSKYSWIHRGGMVNYFVSPSNTIELLQLAQFLYHSDIPFRVIGHTSNMYIRNATSLEVVVSTRCVVDKEETEQNYILGAGVPISKVAKEAVKRGFVGYEGLVNLPGTVAGAVVNNAGCYQCAASDLMVSATLVLSNGKVVEWERGDFDYAERSSVLKKKLIDAVVVRVTFRKSEVSDKQALAAQALSNEQHRKQTQDGPAHNLGSVFPQHTLSAFYAHIPRLVRFVLWRIPVRYRSRFLLLVYAKRHLRKYVSKLNINCFLWLDEGADSAFEEYAHWITAIAQTSDIEIEII